MDALTSHGEWVTHPAWASDDPPWEQPTLRTRWHLAGPPVRAVLHVLGLGVWHARIGGVPVSADLLEPGVSTFETRVSARSYDVTGLLRAGENELVLQLGEGPAHVRAAPGRYTKFVGGTLGPRARVVLELEDATGRHLLGSDSGWQARLGPTVFCHWYGGEDYDARLEPAGWLTATTSNDGWGPVAVLGGPADGPTPWRRRAPAMRVQQVVEPAAITRHPTSFVVDLGRNIAGVPKVTITGLDRGASLVLRPAEYLSEGQVDQCSTGSPILDTYTSAGTPAVWQTQLVYHGFQYLQVEQRDPAGRPVAPDPEQIRVQALQVMTDDRPTGALHLGDPVLQGIDDLITNAAQSNLMTVPTDCPHREKLGWLEQLHLVFEPLAFRWDVREHFHDMITHMGDAQTSTGLIPDIAPELVVFDFDWEPGFRDDVNWGGAIWHLPALLWRHYGTLEPAEQAWEAGLRYLSYLDDRAGDGLLATGLGDWIALDESTPRPLVAAWGHARVLDSAATLARALGRPADERRMRSRAAEVRGQIAEQYTGELASGSQATAALLADSGALDEDNQARAVDHLITLLREGDDQLTVGEIALPAVLRTLVAAEEHEQIYRFVTQTAGPSYGQMLADGATALVEHWTGMRSRKSANHFMLGAIGTWFLESVAGLRHASDGVGWRRAVVSPRPLDSVPTASLTFDSPGGTYVLDWQREADQLRIRLDVPAQAEAQCVPPPGYSGPVEVRGSGRHEITYTRRAR
ncbi:family 78 glycoside hydrolase catalytic domain [Ruania zhangjianzhongii]|uniref:family 78 glycoside hydrolase catalytic domain n=1 Tax=Ruania zhangjianzhongii TaxID=2603206 RepID=UPI0011CB7B3C|nr:family 78 glycoside hydrolase catalytic domain [Ruania zhangjianzhongii]